MVSKNKKKIQRDARDVSDVVTIESVNSTRTAYARGTRENFTILNVTNVTTKPKREGNEVYSSKPTKRKLKAHEEEARPKRQPTDL